MIAIDAWLAAEDMVVLSAHDGSALDPAPGAASIEVRLDCARTEGMTARWAASYRLDHSADDRHPKDNTLAPLP